MSTVPLSTSIHSTQKPLVFMILLLSFGFYHLLIIIMVICDNCGPLCQGLRNCFYVVAAHSPHSDNNCHLDN